MARLITKEDFSLNDAGDTRRVTIKKSWLPILGLEGKDQVTSAVYYSEKHDGYFLAIFDSEDQPGKEDIDLEEIEEDLSQKVDVVDEQN